MDRACVDVSHPADLSNLSPHLTSHFLPQVTAMKAQSLVQSGKADLLRTTIRRESHLLNSGLSGTRSLVSHALAAAQGASLSTGVTAPAAARTQQLGEMHKMTPLTMPSMPNLAATARGVSGVWVSPADAQKMAAEERLFLKKVDLQVARRPRSSRPDRCREMWVGPEILGITSLRHSVSPYVAAYGSTLRMLEFGRRWQLVVHPHLEIENEE